MHKLQFWTQEWSKLNWLNAQEIINNFGDWAAVAVMFIIFFETAFILTSFLPGDSLLFLTGLTLATSQSWLPDWLGIFLIWLAALLGTQTGYWVGHRIGPPLFERYNNFILNPRVLARTHDFFERYGPRAVILARFIPILRALIPMLAGMSDMETRKFSKYNFWGATLWTMIFVLGGYFLGQVPLIKQHLETTVIVIIVVTSLILPVELIRERIHRKRHTKR